MGDCADIFKKWMFEKKKSIRLDGLRPSSWFRSQWEAWQLQLIEWNKRHREAAKQKAEQEKVEAEMKAEMAKAEENDLGLGTQKIDGDEEEGANKDDQPKSPQVDEDTIDV